VSFIKKIVFDYVHGDVRYIINSMWCLSGAG